MEIDYPETFSIDEFDEEYLWKYTDLYKLMDLIKNHKIHFARLDHFEDGLEGLIGRELSLWAFVHGISFSEGNIDPGMSQVEQIKAITNNDSMRGGWDLFKSNLQRSQFASCWFLGKKESMAMWKIHSLSNGIALRFNAKQFIETVIASAKRSKQKDFCRLYFGEVNYKDHWPLKRFTIFDKENIGLKKDAAYDFEKEFRFVAVIPKSTVGKHEYLKLPIGSLKSMDVKIIANPFMENWQYNVLQSLLKKHKIDEKLVKSTILINL